MRRRLILRSASKTWATTGWNIAPITPGATPYPASKPAKNPATTWIARPQSRSRSASVISYSSRTATSPSPASESSSSSSAAAWASMSWSSASTAERYRSKLMQRPPARIPASGSTGRPQALPPVRLTGWGPAPWSAWMCSRSKQRGRSSGVKLVLADRRDHSLVPGFGVNVTGPKHRRGQQVPGMADLLGGQGRRPPEAHVAGAGGVQSLLGTSTISPRMNSASKAKTWKTSRPPGVVVVSSASPRLLKPTPCRCSGIRRGLQSGRQLRKRSPTTSRTLPLA